ncbi:isoprenylcysteine carboxyl methyltransferase family protein [Antribacter sp. KLBMP9083]|uniref:Isoprenylcysteine carboxyl methyltransferase family protein n=1 Tax=Antribacter soli TaxID=2910976 RepID=A0AA41QD60_9MICO|nr:isoprenylcysteine carboxyl methyltransferase family protein [Antribacter soli]MCF4120967.1 isoprenylcysteine carboxyl methyltransferase family protein [Antribacter soli]
MTSELLFTVLVLAVGLERLAELVLSRRHARWAFARGAKEYGSGHYGPMVVLHSALLVGSVAEVWLLGRAFLPALGWTMLAIVVAAQALRWWCIATLGRQWNTRVIVVPGLALVNRGPYRLLRHPNYVAVVLEGAALPLVHSAWITACLFTVLDAWLLTVRIRVEDRALATASSPAAS